MKKVKGFALLIIGISLILPMTIVNRHYVDAKYGDTNGYWQSTAKNIDVWANVEFRATWNARLITSKAKAKFGIQGETISSVLGKNQIDNTLTKEGWKLVKMLNRLEKNHCILWINYEIGNWVDPR